MAPVPQLPLLAPWYRLVPHDDRLLLEHGQSVVVLEGAAVRALLPALLPLLDGSRSRDDLVHRLGAATRPAVDRALELLAEHDLLVEGPDVPVDVRAAAYAVAAAYDLSPAVAGERLRGAAVGVVGSSAAADEIARLLRSAGVGDVSRASWGGGDRFDLVVVAPDAEEFARVDEWNLAALASETCWLPVMPYDGRYAAVGPLIVPSESCCYECLRRRRAGNLAYGEFAREIEAVSARAQSDPTLDAVAVAVAAHLGLRWLAGRDPAVPGVLHAVEIRPELSLTAHPVLRVPRCPACSSATQVAPRLPWHEAEAAA